MDLKTMVEQFLADGVLTEDEHEELMDRIHADGKIDAEEKEIISRVFSAIQAGQLTIINNDRAKSEALRKDEIKQKLLQKKPS